MTKTIVANTVRRAGRPVPDHRRDWAWVNEHLDEYRGKWVLVFDGRLVAADPDIRRLRNGVQRKDYSEAMVTYIPTEEEAQRIVL
jgi:Family of unknown function (DUF5678)